MAKTSFTALLARVGLDWFVLALLAMIGVARLWPEPGMQTGPLSLSSLTNVGVSFIFFFYGLKLNFEQLKSGLRNYRLHLLIHLTTFGLFPALVLAARALLIQPDTVLLWMGIFYVAALPSTVSSSVVMVSLAGGNLPAAIFNASISSLIGVFITPIWMSVLLTSGNGSFDLQGVMIKLSLQVIVPVLLGLGLNQRLGWLAARYKTPLRYFDQITILLIVYTSFCESFTLNLFADYSVADLLWLSAGMLALFFVVYGLVWLACRFLNFSRADQITALFCGSKKSLVQGSVMAKVLFSASTAGVALLPIMVYHALQLIVASILAQRMAAQTEASE
ncbi:bile acid:sodium symporter [Rudanella paleaurantiibacter]|uniref:Bile acid:sodium symporter n=1 Tax=Rudanella paleaurantiibacter TaxID=2614655 RepID=A0A7J5U7E6_9BACT|nr:bile acid:sodium symporter family protein [Rudanella paleaurantiibacter]KAB7733080.1 bile acid:sodium symporter [Rudanella paleaurantiibacter]